MSKGEASLALFYLNNILYDKRLLLNANMSDGETKSKNLEKLFRSCKWTSVIMVVMTSIWLPYASVCSTLWKKRLFHINYIYHNNEPLTMKLYTKDRFTIIKQFI